MAIIAVTVLLSAEAMAQNPTADSLAKQADYYMDHSISSTYSPKKALELYTQAANLGNAKSMNAVGVCNRQGLGTAPNQQNAISWFTHAGNAGYAKAWYNLAMLYKDNRDFTSCYKYLLKAAALGDEQSIYFMGYMQYKGLGCFQNYTAARLKFARGLALGNTNSMYYYGLCLRNGYGVAQNIDSARYWLMQSANMGNTMAADELAAPQAEHAVGVGGLASKIKAAQKAMPTTKTVNKYVKLEHNVNASEVSGTYTGYLLKYDWSGQNIIEANKLTVTLSTNGDSLSGTWAEDDSLTIPIHATYAQRGLLFKQMQYGKTNHYSIDKAELAIFKQANLQLDKIGDSVYLSGNIQQFIPSRNEPAKPLFLALVRSKASTGNSLKYVEEPPLRAYPNPFGSTISIDFELKEASNVTTELLTMDGKVVYSNPAGTLSAGSYSLPIQTQKIAAGYYTLVLHSGNKIRTAKVVKL